MTQVKGLVDAFDAFIVGCKSDGIWDAIKACCILAGWDGLNGCLVPLKGAAPTNNNFVSGDYSRTAGLTGNGTTKYLDSNRNNNADPQNSKHLVVFVSDDPAPEPQGIIGTNTVASGGSWIGRSTGGTTSSQRANSNTSYTYLDAFPLSSQIVGISRSASNAQTHIASLGVLTSTIASTVPLNENILVFRSTGNYSTFSIAFYSIGEAIDLALLDSRVTTLITSIGTALA